jgi:PAS domain S-box-containing protein
MTADSGAGDRRLKLLCEIADCTRSAANERAVLRAAIEALARYAGEIRAAAAYWQEELIAATGIAEPGAISLPLLDSGYLCIALDDRAFAELIGTQISGALGRIRSVEAFSLRAEQQLLLMVRASSTLLGRPDTPDVLEKILALAQQFVAADAYAVWRRQSADGYWRAVVLSGLSPAFDAHSWETGQQRPMAAEALAFEDVFAHEFLAPRWANYRIEGICSMLTVPLRIHDSVTGTVVFYYRARRSFSSADKTLATAVGNLAAAAIEISELYSAQEKLRRDAEDGHKRALFLASAGTLLASSLDVDATLKAIAGLAVPEIADWCTIHLADAAGTLHRVSVRHVDPERMRVAESIFDRYAIRPDSPLYRVLATGRSLLIEEVTNEQLRAGARSPEHYAALKAAGLRSSIFAPLIVHGQKLGVMNLLTADSGRRYTAHDLELVEDLASRAAFAVHSARLHREVLESAERLRISAAAAGLGVIEWNLETGAMAWDNPRTYEIFGRPPKEGPVPDEELFGQVLHPEDRDAVWERFRMAARPGASLQTVFRIYRPDGELRIVELAGRCELIAGTGARRLLGVIADITERRRLEERLREAARLESIGVLAGGVAHDFNNLLTGIMGNSSLALETLEPGHPAFHMIDCALQASDRAAALIRQLLAYSGRGRFVLESVDLSGLFREITGLIRMSIPKNADVMLELAEGLPAIEGDPAQMRQLAMNLVINAAEALEGKAGSVVVRTGERQLDRQEVDRFPQPFVSSPGRYVWVEVRDTGCGMSEATLKMIFDPFFSTKFTGRGLGLSAVQGIVRGHKGSLEVESALGRGTTFRVFIPAKQYSPSTIIEL